MVPEAIRPSYVHMYANLDVFNMFSSIESAGRHFVFLHKVPQGEFPCFVGTSKALRLPAAHPTTLRFHRLVVPRLHSLREQHLPQAVFYLVLHPVRKIETPTREQLRFELSPIGNQPR